MKFDQILKNELNTYKNTPKIELLEEISKYEYTVLKVLQNSDAQKLLSKRKFRDELKDEANSHMSDIRRGAIVGIGIYRGATTGALIGGFAGAAIGSVVGGVGGHLASKKLQQLINRIKHGEMKDVIRQYAKLSEQERKALFAQAKREIPYDERKELDQIVKGLIKKYSKKEVT